MGEAGNKLTHIINFTPEKPLVQFHFAGEEVSRLYIEDGKLHFKGNLGASAKLFFDGLRKHVDAHIAKHIMAMKKRVTKAEFVSQYSALLGKSVEELTRIGLTAQPCSCKNDRCQGWKITKNEEISFTADLPGCVVSEETFRDQENKEQEGETKTPSS